MADYVEHARRAFLSRLGTGAVAAGVMATSPTALAQTSGRAWQPARHAQDDWLDQLSGIHRFVLDTTSPAGFDAAMLYVSNFFTANGTGYGLKDTDLAVVVVARHDSTPFAYNGSRWGKHGPALTQRSGFIDPATKAPPGGNIHRRAPQGLRT